jgi:hypothetical protein
MPDWPGKRKPSDQPAKDDLSGVLTRLMKYCKRKTRITRRRLANNDLTQEYMEAGLRVCATEFAPPAKEHDWTDEEFEDLPAPFFSWLSRKRVIAEVARGRRGLRGSDGTLRDRWPYQSHFIGDLLSYALFWRRRSAVIAQARKIVTAGAGAPDFSSTIEQAAYRNLEAASTSPAQRVAFIAITLADRDRQLKEICGEIYEDTTESWRAVYDESLKTLGLRFRPDINVEEFTYMLTALLEGMTLREIGDPNVDLLDRNRKTSLLGKAIWALMAGAIDTGDGKSLATVVDELGGDTRRHGS